MKFLPFLLACLVVAAAFNLTLDIRQRTQSRFVASSAAKIVSGAEPSADFEQRLARIDDPAELRRVARVQREKALAAHQMVALLSASFRQLADSTLQRGILLFAISLGLTACKLLEARSRQLGEAPPGQRGTPRASLPTRPLF